MTSIHIPLAKTDIGDGELSAAAGVMRSGRLASGPEIVGFESEFSAYLGVDHAVMTSSGTAALVAVLRAYGVGSGDEVIMPSLTFVATVNAVLQCGAVPVLVDVNYSGLLDPDSIRAAISDRTRAIIPVDLYGQCADVASARSLVSGAGGQQHSGRQIVVIEDAAEALGARMNRCLAGSLDEDTGAHAAIFGFYPNKILTTGEGGMIAINDHDVEQRCRALINQGRSGGEFDPAAVPGFSARSTEMSAAIGRAQLRSLSSRLAERQQIAGKYLQVLLDRKLSPLIPPLSEGGMDGEISWFTMPIVLPVGVDRRQLMLQLAAGGIESADYFPAIHTIDAFVPLVKTSGNLAVSEDLGGRLLCLPFWPGITPHIDEIVEAVVLALATQQSS